LFKKFGPLSENSSPPWCSKLVTGLDGSQLVVVVLASFLYIVSDLSLPLPNSVGKCPTLLHIYVYCLCCTWIDCELQTVGL